jgi:hypothetical protein
MLQGGAAVIRQRLRLTTPRNQIGQSVAGKQIRQPIRYRFRRILTRKKDVKVLVAKNTFR